MSLIIFRSLCNTEDSLLTVFQCKKYKKKFPPFFAVEEIFNNISTCNTATKHIIDNEKFKTKWKKPPLKSRKESS